MMKKTKILKKLQKKIQSYDSSIYVKIPIIKTNGKINVSIVSKLHKEGIQINVTAIFYKEQIDSLKDCFTMDTNVIISIFGGRINDYGLDCRNIVEYAVKTFKEYKNIKILWAACRSVYNIMEAYQQGAHIITVPESVLLKINRLNEDPNNGSLETVTTFRKDGINGNIKFEE